MVVGQNGIFKKATTAKEETKQQTILETWNLLSAESKLYEQTEKEELQEEYIKNKLEEAGITFGENNYATWEEFKNGSIITIKDKELKYAELYTGEVELSTLIVNVTSEDNVITDLTGKKIIITNTADSMDTQSYTLQAGEISHEFSNLKIGKTYTVDIDEYSSKYYEFNKPNSSVNIEKTNNISNINYEIRKLYLYNKGDMCETITGGWYVKGFRDVVTPVDLQINSDSMSITKAWAQAITTRKPINVANYKKIKFQINYATTTQPSYIMYADTSKFGWFDTGNEYKHYTFYNVSKPTIFELDVRDIVNKNMYPGVYGNGESLDHIITVEGIWLEK